MSLAIQRLDKAVDELREEVRLIHEKIEAMRLLLQIDSKALDSEEALNSRVKRYKESKVED